MSHLAGRIERIDEPVDPRDLASAQARQIRFGRNCALFQERAQEIYTRHRGKCVCVAGQEIFVAETPEEAMVWASEAHPEDDAPLVRYIPHENVPRIYAR